MPSIPVWLGQTASIIWLAPMCGPDSTHPRDVSSVHGFGMSDGSLGSQAAPKSRVVMIVYILNGAPGSTIPLKVLTLLSVIVLCLPFLFPTLLGFRRA